MAVILHVPSAWGSLGFVSRYGVHACTSPKGILKISNSPHGDWQSMNNIESFCEYQFSLSKETL